MASLSPTSRSLKHLRDAGYVAEVVERWNHITKTRKDLFGIADILAIRPDEVLLVQTTSRSNVSARVKKITESPLLGDIRKAGMGIHVHGWAKMANGRWEMKLVDCS